ncbi:carbohydrate ABC transporter permease [Euzebya sp.]|uniref:carbohydrate ABC transporter permease n=1 Tax=Euzebya sp. TaxID=1971409 RepID=UPI003513F010
MTATTASQVLARTLPAPRWVAILIGWHLAHGVAAVAAAVAVTAGSTVTGGPAAGVLTALSAVVIGDLVAVIGLARRRQAGMVAAVVVDYLTFVAATAALLQVTDVLTGLDALGGSFARGVPFGALAVVAYAATTWERTRAVARWVAVTAVGAMLIAVGALPGLVTFAGRVATPTGLGLLTLAAVSALAAVRTRHADVARHLGATTRGDDALAGLLFVSPNLLGFLAFFAGPLLFSLWMSLNEWDAFAEPVFLGLDNYVRIVSLTVATVGEGQRAADVLLDGYAEVLRIGDIVVGAQDPLFWTSIRNILVFAALALPLSVIPALFLASLLNSDAPGIKAFRALYFVPSIAGVVAVALIWRQLFNATVGWVNHLLDVAARAWSAIPLLPDVAAGQPQWLSDDGLAMISLVIVFAWQYTGFNTVLFLAGLQSIDRTLHEAAMIDGATRWQRFRHITLPQLAPTTFFVVASTGILALQLFGEAVVLFPTYTPIGAGPQNATLTPVVYLYDQGFRRFSQGYASAVAWVLFLLIFAFTFVQFRRQRADVEGA